MACWVFGAKNESVWSHFDICIYLILHKFQRRAVFTKAQILAIVDTPPPTKEESSRNVEYWLNAFKCYYGVFELLVDNYQPCN